jgi:hypothetical protein
MVSVPPAHPGRLALPVEPTWLASCRKPSRGGRSADLSHPGHLFPKSFLDCADTSRGVSITQGRPAALNFTIRDCMQSRLKHFERMRQLFSWNYNFREATGIIKKTSEVSLFLRCYFFSRKKWLMGQNKCKLGS